MYVTNARCRDLNPPRTYHALPPKGSELEKADYSLAARQKVVKLLGQWVLLYGRLLKDDPVALDFLEVRPPPCARIETHTGFTERVRRTRWVSGLSRTKRG